MKKTFKIEVDCANCAAKVEDAVNKIEGVERL
jgi:copper chaperone CopZ